MFLCEYLYLRLKTSIIWSVIHIDQYQSTDNYIKLSIKIDRFPLHKAISVLFRYIPCTFAPFLVFIVARCCKTWISCWLMDIIYFYVEKRWWTCLRHGKQLSYVWLFQITMAITNGDIFFVNDVIVRIGGQQKVLAQEDLVWKVGTLLINMLVYMCMEKGIIHTK